MFALALYVMPTGVTLGQLGQMFSATLAVFSPVLAGIIVYRLSVSQEQAGWRGKRWLAFLIALMIATAVAFLSLKFINHVPIPWHKLVVVGALQALIPAYVLSFAFSKFATLRDFLSTLIRPRGNLRWYLIAIFTFPIVHLLGTLGTSLVKGTPAFAGASFTSGIFVSFGVSFLNVLFFAGGLNEESGWRGFAIKHLQARFSPLVLLIWHIPNDFIQYRSGGYLQVRLLLFPFITILLTWVYNRTNGSILAPAIFHASMNSMNPLMGILPFTPIGDVLLIAFAIFALVKDKMWQKLPLDHPAVHQPDKQMTEVLEAAAS
jgi:membrane protease YdiL (CAAX protease family)